MKTSLYFLISLFAIIFFVNSVDAQIGFTQWQWLNPKPLGTNINDIHIINNSTIIAVGESGFIGRTINSGSSWNFITRTIAPGTSTPSFNAVHFPNTLTGYIVGNNNLLLKTTDGGLNWSTINSPLGGNLATWKTVFFTNETNGWIAGAESGTTPILYKTSDGGLSWTTSSNLPPSAAGQTLNTIRFLNSNFGIITATSGKIFKTTNGGLNWGDISITNTGTPNPSTASYQGLGIVNEQILIVGATNNSILMRTTDGGATWTKINLASIGFSLATSPFLQIDVNGDNVLVSSGGGYRLLSTNQGLNWNYNQIYTSSVFANTQFSAAKISTDGSKYFLMGNFGIYADSVSGSGFWNKPYFSIDYSTTASKIINSISFLNSNTAIAAGDAGIIYKTSDGGQSWANLSIPTWLSPAIDIRSIDYPASNSAYLGAGNSIYKSTNGGVNWNQVHTISDGGFGTYTASDFINATTGWHVHSTGRVSKTINGTSWTEIDPNSSISSRLNGVDFVDANTGWICGNGAQIYKSVNGGDSWNQLAPPPGTTQDLFSMIAVDDQNIFAAGAFGKIIKTSNGGSTWFDISIPNVFIPFQKILFISNLKGFVFGFNGNAFYTDNGGLSWTDIAAPSNDILQDACIKGDFGSIIPQLNDENLIVVGGRLVGGAQRPLILNLRLNSITPVNTIFSISESPFTWQCVSNRLTIVNNNLTNGRYSITIHDAAGKLLSSHRIDHPGGIFNKVVSDPLSAGIYFVTIAKNNGNKITIKTIVS